MKELIFSSEHFGFVLSIFIFLQYFPDKIRKIKSESMLPKIPVITMAATVRFT